MSSEKILYALSLIAFVVSGIGAGITYYEKHSSSPQTTGNAIVQDYGTVNLTISTSVAINFTINNINFGSGFVNPGTLGATLMTGGGNNSNASGWVNVTQGFVVANIGNINVSLWLVTNKTAASFLGGTSPSYQYNVTNNQSSCPTLDGNTTHIFNTWYNVNTTNATSPWFGDYICRNMSFMQGNNNLTIDIKLFVPSDSFSGPLGDFMTATAQNSY